MAQPLSIRQFASYVGAALLAFLATIAAREVFAWLLPADTPGYYLLSMVLAYSLGIVVNYNMQFRHTFRGSQPTWGRFAGFVAVAIVGAGVTFSTSFVSRYWLFDLFVPEYSATLAFIFGNVVASVSTYVLNAVYVFRHRA